MNLRHVNDNAKREIERERGERITSLFSVISSLCTRKEDMRVLSLVTSCIIGILQLRSLCNQLLMQLVSGQSVNNKCRHAGYHLFIRPTHSLSLSVCVCVINVLRVLWLLVNSSCPTYQYVGVSSFKLVPSYLVISPNT